MFKVLWINTLLAFMLPMMLPALKHAQNVFPKKNENLKYAGPVIYSHDRPPIVQFPSPSQIPKGSYRPSQHPVKYVPFSYGELPVVIYQSENRPPIHVIEHSSKNSVGESSPYENEYSVENDKYGVNDLHVGASELKSLRTLVPNSSIRTVLEQEPVYFESSLPNHAYIYDERNGIRSPRNRGMYPPGLVHGHPKLITADQQISGSELSIHTASIPKFHASKRQTSSMLSPLSSNNYFNRFITMFLDRFGSRNHNINNLLGMNRYRPTTTRSPALRNRMREYRLRKALGLGKPTLSFLSGYGNQAVDPAYETLLSEQITQSFIDELSNYGSHGMLKYGRKKHYKFDPETWKFDDFEHEDPKSVSETPSTTPHTSSTTTTTTTTTTTPAPVHTKPPIIIFQGIRPPVHVYKKPTQEETDDEIIVPPSPRYHKQEVLHQESPPLYKSPPYKKFTFPFENVKSTSGKRNDDYDTKIISPNGNEGPWKPITEKTIDGSVSDLKNHRFNSA